MTETGADTFPDEVLSVKALATASALKVHYALGKKTVVRAVDGVDLSIGAGQAVALVGESGCGKSTLGRALLRLEDPSEGRITFEGRELTELSQAVLRPLRRSAQETAYSAVAAAFAVAWTAPTRRSGRLVSRHSARPVTAVGRALRTPQPTSARLASAD